LTIPPLFNYTTSMTETTDTEKNYFDMFIKESTAASDMRYELCYITGLLTFDNPEIKERLEKVLAKHKEDRDQHWF